MKKLLVIIGLFITVTSLFAQRKDGGQDNRTHIDQAFFMLGQDYNISLNHHPYFSEVTAIGKPYIIEKPILRGIIDSVSGYFIIPLEEYMCFRLSGDTAFYIKAKDKVEWGYYTRSGKHAFAILEITDAIAIIKDCRQLARKEE